MARKLEVDGVPVEQEQILTCAEVARMFRVDPKTVSRWERKGLLPCFRTAGNHRRFRASDVAALLKRNGAKP